jgi:ribosomal protein S4
LFERQTIFVLKKIKFVKTIKQGVSGLLHKYFFVDNQVITNPQYLIGNNTIIQKKIYSSSLNTLLFFKQKKKLRLLVK